MRSEDKLGKKKDIMKSYSSTTYFWLAQPVVLSYKERQITAALRAKWPSGVCVCSVTACLEIESVCTQMIIYHRLKRVNIICLGRVYRLVYRSTARLKLCVAIPC